MPGGGSTTPGAFAAAGRHGGCATPKYWRSTRTCGTGKTRVQSGPRKAGVAECGECGGVAGRLGHAGRESDSGSPKARSGIFFQLARLKDRLTRTAKHVGVRPTNLSERLLRACRFKQSAHGGDTTGGKTYAFGVFLDGRFVRSEIDAVHLVAGDIAVEPLDLGTHSLQDVDRLLGDFAPLGVG